MVRKINWLIGAGAGGEDKGRNHDDMKTMR